MGMMVDNAIVVTDGIGPHLPGHGSKAGGHRGRQWSPQYRCWATVVACMAFFPIFASSYDTGEYAGSLFTVVAISLLLSWSFVRPSRRCCAWLCCRRNRGKQRSTHTRKVLSAVPQLLSRAIRYRAVPGQFDGTVACPWLAFAGCHSCIFRTRVACR